MRALVAGLHPQLVEAVAVGLKDAHEAAWESAQPPPPPIKKDPMFPMDFYMRSLFPSYAIEDYASALLRVSHRIKGKRSKSQRSRSQRRKK